MTAPARKYPEEPGSAKQLRAAESVAAFAAPAIARMEAPRRRSFRSTRDTIDRARVRMREMAKANDWREATGVHLVALYEWLHREVYGVDAAELDGKAWAAAASLATKMVRDYFDGDLARAVEFVGWAWTKEAETEAWRRTNGRSGRRIGWRLQFSGTLVTDYRVDAKRRPGA